MTVLFSEGNSAVKCEIYCTKDETGFVKMGVFQRKYLIINEIS
jgi:hypothetical protein